MCSARTLNTFQRGLLCLELVEQDPSLGGVILRGRPGPVREALITRLPSGTRRIHPAMDDTALFGGMDVTATLSQGKLVETLGLTKTGDPILISMAERLARGQAVRVLDAVASNAPVFAVDESDETESVLSDAFTERLAFLFDLSDISIHEHHEVLELPESEGPIETADAIVLLAQISLQFGISSLRAPEFALKTVRGLARLRGSKTLDRADVGLAAEMVFAHRATVLPAPPQDTDQPAEPETQSNQQPAGENANDAPLEDQIIEAVKALVPPDLLVLNSKKRSKSSAGAGAGAAKSSNRRGRPISARPGKPHSGARLDIIASLRAAAPFQGIRKKHKPRQAVAMRPSDLRIKRFEEKSDRLIIFAVDASGSSATGRLAEAKGAVELLLADAYARRDHVALIAFRGSEAEVLLPATRSLVLTKRRLAALPGGGGTPLASGLEAAAIQAITARRRGMTPTICVLTDGRANVTLQGTGNRKKAAQDARDISKMILAEGIDAVIIDTGRRPERDLRTLATVMDAAYVSLPRADANGISRAVAAGLHTAS